jgi:Na+/H+ antiporter NhaD/arsenite permease-like protein
MVKKIFLIFISLCLTVFAAWGQDGEPDQNKQESPTTSYNLQEDQLEHTEHSEHSQGHETDHHFPSPWAVLPFVILLTMIATGPIFYEHFWHHHYPKVAVILAAITISYYLFFLGNSHGPIHAFFEYFQFIALLAALFIAAGGIMINIHTEGRPMVNVAILLFGAIIANIIGTTGASMLLIRPFVRLNRRRIQPYHIIFFILIVSNVGGCLTPIGDPPLFLGFLKGVPFDWNLTHNFFPWLVASSLIAIIFVLFDKRFSKENPLFAQEERPDYANKVEITGSRNFFILAMIIGAVFLDPVKVEWIAGIIMTEGHGTYIGLVSNIPEAEQAHYTAFSFLRELIMLSLAFVSYRFANKKALLGNEFNFEPIREVAFIFIGIFGTMLPALELVGSFAASPEGARLINPNTLYWGTGIISGFLDNAPTYLNFFTAAIAAKGGTINEVKDVMAFAYGEGKFVGTELYLTAISIAAVFFGALSYIGNGPNFMVKSIAEQIGIEMPSFFGYILRYSLPILFPVLIVIWLIFIFPYS